MKEYKSLCHTKWDCEYRFWARGYFVLTVGLDEQANYPFLH